jgi:arginase
MTADKATKRFGLLGVPFGLCARSPGCERGPATLRAFGLVEHLQALQNDSIIMKDYADTPEVGMNGRTPTDEKIKFKNELLEYATILLDRVLAIYQDGYKPLIVGGDHSISITTIAAAVKHHRTIKPDFRLGILWVDAHGDICSPENTLTGNVHGMSLAHLLGNGDKDLASIGGFTKKIEPNNLVYIGLRSLDQPERIKIKEMGIKAYSMKEVDLYGIGTVISQSLNYLNSNFDQFWLSFDLDVCDPEITPGVGTPVRGGLTFREAHLIMEMVAESYATCCGIELVEYSPDMDCYGATGKTAIGLLESAAGKNIL